MWENTDQKNFEYGHFSQSDSIYDKPINPLIKDFEFGNLNFQGKAIVKIKFMFLK